LVTETETVSLVATAAAGTITCSCVDEIYVVAKVVAPNDTREPETKLEPVTVSVNAAPLAFADMGSSPAIAGAGLTTGIVACTVPPPGAAVETRRVSDVVAPSNDEGTVASISSAFMSVDGSKLPARVAVVLDMYPDPNIFRISEDVPTVRSVGDVDEIVGAGTVCSIVNRTEPDDAPPVRLPIVIDAWPDAVNRLDGTVAVSLVDETKVVLS